MSLESTVFKKKKVQFNKLADAGFVKNEQGYTYAETILNGEFEVRVQIDKTGTIKAQVFDVDLGEEYTAIHVSRATGAFVGQVREAYLTVLEYLADSCFEALPFSKDQTNRLADRINKNWADPLDYPFEKHTDYASYRIGGKWYALIFPLKLGKLGFSGEQAEQVVEVVNLKVEATDMDKLLAKVGIFPSYHMSKKSWISVVLDDSLSDEELWQLVSKSRNLANPNPLRNSEGPDFWIIPANPKYFDIDAEFAQHKIVYWSQKGKIKKDDWVCIYVTAPVQAIRYVCRCLGAEIENNLYPEEPEINKLMQVELVQRFEDSFFPFEVMKELGVRAVRGPRRMTRELIEAVKKKVKEANQDEEFN